MTERWLGLLDPIFAAEVTGAKSVEIETPYNDRVEFAATLRELGYEVHGEHNKARVASLLVIIEP